MISIQTLMLVALGFSAAALLGSFLAPFYRRRAARLATDELRRSVPLTAAEIAADKDRLRADFALKIHALETKLGDAEFDTARQLVEINRRDASINKLESDVGRLKTDLEEHENARRVLEQTIIERLPKVEYRLGEAKKLLFERDKEISALTQESQRQSQALDEATQINTQQRDEMHRLNATLTTRAARNREAVSDPRFDSEVALRSEIEALRTKLRDQAQVINRLQRSAKDGDGITTMAAGETSALPPVELAQLRVDLADAERALQLARNVSDSSERESKLTSELRALKAKTQDQVSEIARLSAALKSYETANPDERAINESKLALKAQLSAADAKANEQTALIQSLRAEVAAGNEKLARQASHYMEEMRRLGAGTRPMTGAPRSVTPVEAPRRPLFERISAPRVEKPAANGNDSSDIAAANGSGTGDTEAPAAAAAGKDFIPMSATAASPAAPVAATASDGKPGRRPGLLQRISGIDKGTG